MPEPEAEVNLAETIEKGLGLVKRRRWWIAAPAFVIALATVFVLYLLPNKYTSEATILVVQQQVPERYVVPTATTDLSKALEAMTQEVLSRTRLLGIIDEFGLYAKEKKRLAAEELVDKMRRDVAITPLQSNPERREINAFKIAFATESPHLAQEVTSRLTTLFIEQNLKRREDQAKTTTRFLNEQLEAAKTKLAEQEQRVRDFKMEHLGELPEQQAGNLGILASLQSQLENVMGNLNRAQQQRLYLESLIGEYRRLAQRRVPLVDASGASQVLSPVEAAQRDLRTLEAERRRLLTQYTPQHPDVIRNSQEIARQKDLIKMLAAAQAETESAKAADKHAANEQASGAESAENSAAVAQLRSQLEANQLEIENLKRTEAKLRTDIEHYQARLNQTPVREQQLASMLRDLELLRQNYADLLKKEQESQLATSLEKRQEGQQFRLVDPPNLPTIPSSPKRLKISLGGLGGGLAIGLALGLLVEMRDSSFHTEKDADRVLKLPLVVGIPRILTPPERRRIIWRWIFEGVAATVMAVAVCAAELYVYRHQ
jgi:succinoglycan biosynthesis transport protein ExoP